MVWTLADVWGEQQAPTLDDGAWIVEAAARGWLALTADKNVRKNPAFHQNPVAVFCLASGNLTGPVQVSRLTDNLKRILEVAASTPRPFFASVHAREVHVSEGRLRPARYWARKRMSRKPSWRWPS